MGAGPYIWLRARARCGFRPQPETHQRRLRTHCMLNERRHMIEGRCLAAVGCSEVVSGCMAVGADPCPSSSCFWQILVVPESKVIDACLGGRGWLDSAGSACMLYGNTPLPASQKPVHSTQEKVPSQRFQALLLEKGPRPQTKHMQPHDII